jgi:hypothetical protein
MVNQNEACTSAAGSRPQQLSSARRDLQLSMRKRTQILMLRAKQKSAGGFKKV